MLLFLSKAQTSKLITDVESGKTDLIASKSMAVCTDPGATAAATTTALTTDPTTANFQVLVSHDQTVKCQSKFDQYPTCGFDADSGFCFGHDCEIMTSFCCD